MGSWAQSSAQLLGRVCTHVHKQQPRNGLEMRLERVNNCLPDSAVHFDKMLVLPRGTKYNFALKVNSILLTEERNECLKSSFIRIPARCTSDGTQGSDHHGELDQPKSALPFLLPAKPASAALFAGKISFQRFRSF